MRRQGQTKDVDDDDVILRAYRELKKESALGAADSAEVTQQLKSAVANYVDLQLSYIKLRLRQRAKNAANSPSEVAYIPRT